MKSIYFSSGVSKQIKLKDKGGQNLGEGVIKGLLEKYKPKILYNIKASNKKKAQRGVA